MKKIDFFKGNSWVEQSRRGVVFVVLMVRCKNFFDRKEQRGKKREKIIETVLHFRRKFGIIEMFVKRIDERRGHLVFKSVRSARI